MADQSPDSLREAAPAYDDFEAKRARAGVAAALFGEPSADDDEHERPSVGRYEIRGRLGAGGMGVVYRAHDPDLDRPVAVKLLHHDASTDDKARARMLREARSLAKLSHPNVIAVYDVGTEDGQVFVAMELVAGLDLRRWLEHHREAGWREVLDLFIAAGRGLEAAHDVALVHRDFKPENVLVGDDGRVRVLDFGLARVGRQVEGPTLEDRAAEGVEGATGPREEPSPAALGSTQRTLDLGTMPTVAPAGGKGGSLTATGTLMGTPLYMAPELYRARPANARSDQFAFCASLYEGFYRQLPFGSRDLQAHVRAVSAGAIVERPADTDVPAHVHEIVVQGLAPDPDDRYADMGRLLEALERAARPEPTPTELPKPMASGRWLAVVGLVVVAVLGIVGIELFGGEGEGTAARAGLRADTSERSRDAVDESPEPSTLAKADTHEAGPELANPPSAGGETGNISEVESEGAQTETGAEEVVEEGAATAKPKLRDWCHFHEDRYILLLRSRKRRSAFEHEGTCYSCRVERRSSRTRNFSPRDCAGYALCGKASAEVCS